MKVIVCGAGQVGYNIARYLAVAGNDVTAIDQRAELTQKIGESLDIQAITGFASHPEVLEQAGAEDAEMLIAVTNADEVNMVTCQVAHSLFNVPTKIARVRHQSYLQSRWRDLFRREHMPIDVIISPELEVARAITRRLEVPGATDVTPFADDRVRLIAARCGPDCPILDTPLRQLTFLFPDLHLTCVGILRGDRFFVPGGDDHLIAGDEVYSVVETSHVARAMRAFGHEEKTAERIVIAGGGNIGLFLAQELEASRPQATLTLIEADRRAGPLHRRQADPQRGPARRRARPRDPRGGQPPHRPGDRQRDQQRRGQHHGGAAGQALRLPAGADPGQQQRLWRRCSARSASTS